LSSNQKLSGEFVKRIMLENALKLRQKNKLTFCKWQPSKQFYSTQKRHFFKSLILMVRWQLVEGANGRRAFRRLYNTSVIWSNIYNLVDWFLPHFYQLSTKWHLC